MLRRDTGLSGEEEKLIRGRTFTRRGVGWGGGGVEMGKRDILRG